MDLPGIVVSLLGSGGIGVSVWAFIKERIKEKDAARKKEIEGFEIRITNAEKLAQDAVSREIETLKVRITKLEKDHSDCEELLRAEIRRSARNALQPRRPDDPIPDRLPTPEEDWYEHTGARIMWDEETQKVIQEAKEEQRKRESDPGELATRSSASSVERTDNRPRVIVIDDDEIFSHALRGVLVDLLPKNWHVETLTDARAGRMVLVMDARVQFAIVDYLMPRIDGEVVIAETLKQRPELRGKIILTSGWTIPDDVAKHLFVELGCLWLKKPIEFKRLKHLVQQVLTPNPRHPNRS